MFIKNPLSLSLKLKYLFMRQGRNMFSCLITTSAMLIENTLRIFLFKTKFLPFQEKWNNQGMIYLMTKSKKGLSMTKTRAQSKTSEKQKRLIDLTPCSVASVMSDFLWPYELWPSRLLCPWDSPGKNNEVDCHALLQGIFPTQGLKLCLLLLLNCRQILYPLSHLGSPHG